MFQYSNMTIQQEVSISIEIVQFNFFEHLIMSNVLDSD